MTFSLHQGGVVTLSQITHTQSSRYTFSPYTWHPSLDFQYLRPFYSLSQPHHVTPSLPSPCDDHQSMGGQSEWTQGQAKMAAWNSFSYICTRALYSFQSFVHWRAASTVIPLLPKATFTPSIQPNLGLPHNRPQLTSAINTLLAIRYSSILSTFPNHLNILYLLYSLTSFLLNYFYRTYSEKKIISILLFVYTWKILWRHFNKYCI